jgi:APA family basic amino acid/polyamine antiporter
VEAKRLDSKELRRGLGPLAAFAIVVGSVVATGIFLEPSSVLREAGSPAGAIGVWLVAGLVSLAGAATYAELAAMKPGAGGEYLFLRDAYGPSWGFLYAWMRFFVANPGGQAALVLAFVRFVDVLANGALGKIYFTIELWGFHVEIGHKQVAALAVVAAVTAINYASVAANGRIAVAVTVVKLGLVVGVGAGAFALADGGWERFAEPLDARGFAAVEGEAAGGWLGLGAAMLGALWAYNGWYSVALVGAEVRDPGRNLPRALVWGVATVVGVYLFLNFAFFYAFPPAEVAGIATDASVAIEAARRIAGPGVAALVAAGLAAAAFGAIHTGMLTNARLPYAVARDGLFYSSYAKLSGSGVPVKALLMQANVTSVLSLSTSLETLVGSVIFATWIFYGLSGATIFVFRRRIPHAERPYRVPGYPWVPAFFVAGTLAVVVVSILREPWQSLLGAATIAAGWPLYLYFSRRANGGASSR